MALVTMCTNGDCQVRMTCYRFRAIPEEKQSFFHPTPDHSGCDYFIPIHPGNKLAEKIEKIDNTKCNNNTNY